MEDIDKDKIIKDVYYAPDGYSSMKNTLEAARTKDKRIKMQDVKAWFNKNVQRTTQLKGQNSYVAPEANFTYAADLFFITKPENLEYKIGLLVIDLFSKFCSVMMLKSKTPDIVLPALEQAFINLGGTPRVLVSDSEGALLSNELNKFYNKNNIQHIILRNHAGTAERMVRTLKSLIFNRLTHQPNKAWYEIIHECLVVLNYIRKSSSTNMIPNEARKKENLWKVKSNLEKHRLSSRKYPDVKVGDMVFLYRKRKNFEKEGQSIWTEKKHEVMRIEDIPHVGKLYYLDGVPHAVVRSDILL